MGKPGETTVLTRKDDSEGRRVAKALLRETGFAGFEFSTQFSLRFTRREANSHAGERLPSEVELVLHGRWWFDDETRWREFVGRLAPPDAVEPEEPVQAYELAAFRWTEGTTVASVEVERGKLVIGFACGRTITALSDLNQGGAAWMLGVSGEREPDSTWSVVSEGGELFVRGPHLE